MASLRVIATALLLLAGLALHASASMPPPQLGTVQALDDFDYAVTLDEAGDDADGVLRPCADGSRGFVVRGVRGCLSEQPPESCPEGYVGQVVGGVVACIPADLCQSAAASMGQSVKWNLKQKVSALEGTGVEVPTAQQIQEVAAAVMTSASTSCPDPTDAGPLDDLIGDLPLMKCVSQSREGWTAVVCTFRCPPVPAPADYYVNTRGEDLESATNDPLVYGAVGCFAGMTPTPPIGTSCLDNGYCYGRFSEGIKWLHGGCVHLVFGNAPTIIERRCEY